MGKKKGFSRKFASEITVFSAKMLVFENFIAATDHKYDAKVFSLNSSHHSPK